MSVVQRCPNCGTTRATAGECEACHEAEVRYFCTNHTPGLWLDTSACPQCGARFGEASRTSSAPAPAPASASPERTRSSASAPARPSARVPASTSTAPSSRPRAARPKPDLGAKMRGRRSPLSIEEERAPGPPGMAPWQRILLAALRARYVPTRMAPVRERMPVGRGAGGCLRRLLLLVVLLFIALAGAVFLFGQALLQDY